MDDLPSLLLQIYQCPHCGIAATDSDIQAHLKQMGLHHNVICVQCTFMFSNYAEYVQHVAFNHAGVWIVSAMKKK